MNGLYYLGNWLSCCSIQLHSVGRWQEMSTVGILHVHFPTTDGIKDAWCKILYNLMPYNVTSYHNVQSFIVIDRRLIFCKRDVKWQDNTFMRLMSPSRLSWPSHTHMKAKLAWLGTDSLNIIVGGWQETWTVGMMFWIHLPTENWLELIRGFVIIHDA